VLVADVGAVAYTVASSELRVWPKEGELSDCVECSEIHDADAFPPALYPLDLVLLRRRRNGSALRRSNGSMMFRNATGQKVRFSRASDRRR